MRHSLRLAIVPLAVGALLLTACGSDDSSSTADSTVAAAAEATGDFNDADVTYVPALPGSRPDSSNYQQRMGPTVMAVFEAPPTADPGALSASTNS